VGFGDVRQRVVKAQEDLHRVRQAIHAKSTDSALYEEGKRLLSNYKKYKRLREMCSRKRQQRVGLKWVIDTHRAR